MADAAWMSGRWGVMVHWIAPGPAPEHGPRLTDTNAAVDRFDLDRFMAQFAATGAQWLIFTVGQNTGYYCSPNAVLDRLAGPGHCSRRDLLRELGERLHELGRRLIVYLPTEVQAPTVLHQPLAWNPDDQTEFEQRFTAFIAEYSRRLGPLVAGWWLDGCFDWPFFPQSDRRWPLWLEAARAGNPEAVVACNDGSLCCGITAPVTPLQDFLSGQAEVLRDGQIRLGRSHAAPLYLPTERFCPGTRCQWHGLLPIDCFWGHHQPGPMEPPKYTDDELIGFVRHCLSVGGAVTLNTGIYQEGHLAAASVAQLARLHAALT